MSTYSVKVLRRRAVRGVRKAMADGLVSQQIGESIIDCIKQRNYDGALEVIAMSHTSWRKTTKMVGYIHDILDELENSE